MPSASPPPFYGHTNVSRPTIQHSLSTRSVAASEDYFYSLPSTAHSDENNADGLLSRYETPQSHLPTPLDRAAQQSRGKLPMSTPPTNAGPSSPPMRGTGRRRFPEFQYPEANPNPLRSNPRIRPIIRKPVPESAREARSLELAQAGPSTIHQRALSADDDRAYIHFALDQLTRDEQGRDSRARPRARSPPRRMMRSSSDTIRPIRATPAVNEQSLGSYTNAPGNRVSAVSAVSAMSATPSHPAPALVTSDVSPVSPLESEESDASSPQELPLRNPLRNSQSFGSPHTQDIFLPYDPPNDAPYLALRALPSVLRPLPLICYLAALLLFTAALIFTAAWSLAKPGLWTYKHFGDSRYFTFEYLPTILAVVLLLWNMQIQIAVNRMSPFLALASESIKGHTRAPFLPLQPSGFLTPTLAHFCSDQPAVGCFLLASWLALFAVPLLSAAYNVYQFGDVWEWVATQGTIWLVIAIYILLIASTVWLFAYLWHRQTGLRWDPTSIADLLVLFEKSNILDLYASCFYANEDHEMYDELRSRDIRLGHWRMSTRPNVSIHTIGAAGWPARRYSLIDGRIIEEPTAHRHSRQNRDSTRDSYTYCSFFEGRTSRQTHHSGQFSAVHRPFILSPLAGIMLSITFITLLLILLILSYLPSTAIQSGFLPDLPIPVNDAGFSAANFLYSFIPSTLGLLMFLLWTHIDMTLRRLQPIANLSRDAKAEHSLLLSYPSDGPVLVTLKALINGDWRVAIVSAIALIAAVLPVLGGGVFWAEFYIPTQTVRIYGDMPGFHAMTAIFAICCLGFLALPLTSSQSRPYSVPSPEMSWKLNHANSLVDIVALTHQSRLLVDYAFHAPSSRIQMVTRLLTGHRASQIQQTLHDERKSSSRISLADGIRGFGDARGGQAANDEEGTYTLGHYTGRDGMNYIGIDRASRTPHRFSVNEKGKGRA